MIFYPAPEFPFRIGRSPVLVDGCYQGLFRTRERIIDDITGSRWAHIVVISPTHIDRYLNQTCKIDHIVIGHRVDFFRRIHSPVTEEMRIAPCPSGLISRHVGKSRMIGHTCRYLRMECRCDQCQSSPLACTFDYTITFLPSHCGSEVRKSMLRTQAK